MRALLDTNILIDFLAGVEPARGPLDRHRDAAVSLVTWMEVLVGARDEPEAALLRGFLRGFEVLPIDGAVAEVAVELRREHRVRLPDAIVWATARVHGRVLVTRDARDLPAGSDSVPIPCRL